MAAIRKDKMTVSGYRIYLFFFLLCGIHWLYILFQTQSELPRLEKVNWESTVYQRHGLSNYRGSISNHTFKNTQTGFEVTRRYSSISGINKSLWGLKKSQVPIPVVFYVKEADYAKMMNHEINYQTDILGNKTIHQEEVPFFALRTNHRRASQLSLMTDLWKYNFSLYFLGYLLIPQAMVLIINKSRFFRYSQPTDRQARYIGIFTLLVILTLGI